MAKTPRTGLSIRVDLGSGLRIGPGKVTLLEAIAETGSISAAGRLLQMSYKRAWDLVEDMNKGFGHPVVSTSAGGRVGGGSTLTETGLTVVRLYREIEQVSARATQPQMMALEGLVPAATS